jgi:hypothetical protein
MTLARGEDVDDEQDTLAWCFTDETNSGPPLGPPPWDIRRSREDAKLYYSGFHAYDDLISALEQADGHILHYARMDGRIIRSGDELVASDRTVLWSINAKEILRTCARNWAVAVIHLWDAPPIVREFLEAGREELRATAEAFARAGHDNAIRAVRSIAPSDRVASSAAQAVAWAAAAATYAARTDGGALSPYDDGDGETDDAVSCALGAANFARHAISDAVYAAPKSAASVLAALADRARRNAARSHARPRGDDDRYFASCASTTATRARQNEYIAKLVMETHREEQK